MRYYATGNFLSENGDLFGVHKCTVSRIIKKISRAIASLYNNYIKFPSGLVEVQRAIMQQNSIPGVVGRIDCTHIFRNRKGFFFY